MQALFIALYLVAQLALGLWVSGRVRNETDFYVGGRNLPVGLVAFSLFATWFGAETCLGTAGAIYESGLSGGRADPFGYAACLLLGGVFLAARLHRGGHLTIGDLYRTRFGPRAEKVAVLVLAPSSILWSAAQIRAFGQVISVTTELDVTVAILVAAGFVISYTLMGGLLGDVVTDVVQGTVLAFGLAWLLVAVLSKHGLDAVTTLEPARLSFFPADERALDQLDRWAVPVLGSLVSAEVVTRMLAARNEAVARRGSLLAAALYLTVGAVPVVLGLLGPRLVPSLDDPEQFLIHLARGELSDIGFVIFAGALVSAILSTIDSALLAISGLVAHNVIVPVFRIQDEQRRLVIARALVAVAGVVGLLIALSAEGIYALVESASALGTAGIFVTTLAGLYTRAGGERPALAALVVGALATPILGRVLDASAPFLGAIALSGITYLVMLALEPPALARA